ncbi:MAG: class I SAM-dependent methyltransferase [Hyphomicrobiales bacterium]|nr:class I SAM-dependent methyltransferase [Hyphomicrobiales bacterium]
MSSAERRAHWDKVYQTKGDDEMTWFQARPDISLDLIRATGVTTAAAIVDVGGGSSRLVDVLLDEGFSAVTVLDLSEHALGAARARLMERGAKVEWIVADVTTWRPAASYDVWHDRAALHFLTEERDRTAYAQRVVQAVRSGGHVIIGTFAPDGPERCSGLPIARHDATSLGRILGSSFALAESRGHSHRTPTGTIQRFQFSRFRRRN